MIYLYNKEAGKPQITLSGDEHRYIFKVRRHKANETIHLRNLEDNFLYQYIINYIDKQTAILELKNSRELIVKSNISLHIGWCIIDPKSIEKVLPSLNEIGVDKITFIYCQRSQKSFKVDFKRFEKILLNSSQQSGRSNIMKLATADTLKKFLEKYPQSKMLNFSDNSLSKSSNIDTIIIGCEGGFHEDEVALFKDENIIGFDTPLVLKSQSAICAVASKIIL